uniref:Uncharacterized protein n=1 Tax=Timema poppense TaxID=170557 RepID=A0A7R9DCA0_TIMPO|nr:unnamed protein product [Timema poppensis]
MDIGLKSSKKILGSLPENNQDYDSVRFQPLTIPVMKTELDTPIKSEVILKEEIHDFEQLEYEPDFISLPPIIEDLDALQGNSECSNFTEQFRFSEVKFKSEIISSLKPKRKIATCKEEGCSIYALKGGKCGEHGGTRNKCKEEGCCKYAKRGVTEKPISFISCSRSSVAMLVVGPLMTTLTEGTSFHERTGGHGVSGVVLTAPPLKKKTSLHEETSGLAVLGVVLTTAPPRKTPLHEGTGGHAVLNVVLTAAKEYPLRSPKYRALHLGNKTASCILGWCNAEATYNGLSATLPVTVVEGNGPSLIRRNWFNE